MRQNTIKYLKAIGIPFSFAVMMRLFFGFENLNQLDVMSWSFLVGSPIGIGALTTFFADSEKTKNIGFQIMAPWLPCLVFLAFTIIFQIEGFACWIMILPFFLIFSSIGGIIGAFFKNWKNDKLSISFLVLLPFLTSPIENIIGAIPGTYEAYTYIDIHSDSNKIWSNVTRVKEIPKEQDKGILTRVLGFPRPVKAELNYEGVGAYREAVFTNGLVFHETVLEYDDKKKMVFKIKANPYEIPSTTMDKHVVIGGNYFDVLTGTYQLQLLDDKTYRLHLYSHFKLITTFNFYASWWARWIMQDIQNNILQVIKARSEKN